MALSQYLVTVVVHARNDDALSVYLSWALLCVQLLQQQVAQRSVVVLRWLCQLSLFVSLCIIILCIIIVYAASHC